MRAKSTANGVTVQVIAGNHAVFFGFDLDGKARDECLGFAIFREDHTDGEKYWLSGFKTFRSVVPVPDPKQMYSSRDHPIQSFYWGDYSAKPGYQYTYRVVPRYGSPKKLEDRSGVEASVDVTTNDPDTGEHGVYFNRGVAASQAYARKFAAPPGSLPDDQRAEAMSWLSRGLDEAIVAFIKQGGAPGKALRVAAYEFTEPGVLGAFQDARDAGGDVEIIYHAKADSTGDQNRTAITLAKLSTEMLIPRRHAVIAHNKFIVLCDKAGDGKLTAEAVWTGSTNLSQGGIFGHSNVGHAVRDRDVAEAYLAYWVQLEGDPQGQPLRAWVSANSPFDTMILKDPGVHTLFSPREEIDPLTWYADDFVSAPAKAGHVTLPFGMSTQFETPLLAYKGQAMHFVMLDHRDDRQDEWGSLPGLLLAVGAEAKLDELAGWSAEQLTGFNKYVPYLHTKIVLVDPLGPDPTVISGSANFSEASTTSNDENMLIIRGNRDVADIYFTEFARIFQHFYARWWAEQLAASPDGTDHSFLVEDPTWQDPYFQEGSMKSRQRVLFSSGVEGNQ